VFETTRKAKWIAESLVTAPIDGVQIVAPTPLTEDEVVEVHDSAYVAAVRTGKPRHSAESQGFGWDAQLFPMVLTSNGGAVAAARAALAGERVAGSLSSGLHHARRAYGAGFCTFNGLAIAARAAMAAGARSVLILDLDAHCGGGTHSLISDEPLHSARRRRGRGLRRLRAGGREHARPRRGCQPVSPDDPEAPRRARTL
jgi:acetoin utilization deacetylase AcuC-like enzyme